MPGRIIKGVAVSPGVAVGPALVVRWEVPAAAGVALLFAAAVRLLQGRATGLVAAAGALAVVIGVGVLW